MMTQINKVFSILVMLCAVVREIEDLIHDWKVISKDCLHFINRICIVVGFIKDAAKRIVLNISITFNKIYNEWV